MPIPDFVVDLRRQVGTALLWLPGVTAVVRRAAEDAADADAVEVLLVKRADNGAWTPVTGIVDPGEEPAVTAAREALEEAGVEVSVDRLASIGVTDVVEYPGGDRAQYVDHTFACTWLAGEAHVADDESVDVGWFTPDSFATLDPPMSAVMRARVDAALSDEVAARFTATPRA